MSVRNSPIIDLSLYEESEEFEGASKIDLHPKNTKNPRKDLRDNIFKYQLAYERSETEDNKVHVITGTGKKRPGPKYTLQNNVKAWLQEEYFSRRILRYELKQEGFFTVYLRKNKILCNGLL